MHRAVPHRALLVGVSLGHHHLKQALFLASFRPNLKTFKTSQRPKIKDYYFLWCLYNLFMKCFCCFDDVFMFFKLTTIFLMSSCCLEPWENGDNHWLRTCQNPRIPMKIKKNAWKKTYLFTQCLWIMLWICYDLLMNSTWLPARNFKNWSISFCWFEPWKNGENHGFWYILHHLGASVIQTFAEHLTCQHPKCFSLCHDLV